MRGDDTESTTGMTVDGIVKKVDELLGGQDGIKNTDRLTGVFRRILDREIDLSVDKKKIRSRRGVAFYLAAGDVREKGIVIDARVWGRKVGEIRLGHKKKHRAFTPANVDRLRRASQPARIDAFAIPKKLEWSDNRVRAYLEAAIQAVESEMKGRVNEAVIESAFLAELAVSRTRNTDKQQLLRRHQPVVLGGFPFQFPLPISARKVAKVSLGNAAGHSDVLARFGSGRRLRVFEVKMPGAPDAGHALEQAVTYAATLRALLKRPDDDVYYRMLGYSSPKPRVRLDAVALVEEGALQDVKVGMTALSSANHHFDLHVMLYKLGGDDGRQLIITREEKLGARSPS